MILADRLRQELRKRGLDTERGVELLHTIERTEPQQITVGHLRSCGYPQLYAEAAVAALGELKATATMTESVNRRRTL